MAKTYYMHTLNGRPATYDGDQICYAIFYGKPNRFADSLKQIRAEQKASREWRTRRGFEDRFIYGYLRYSP